ncbi:hypothetical protein F0U60_27275 [Archangium minus]|uniref:Lipoprotein n=1 Tax=Archangium minus TaxID=83450 RepID=A0ABY9WW91_9BACT|nr:hypothetical protein F0U60_27275 [Archangium minus]
MRSVCRLGVLCTVLASAVAAHAEPYELFAIYAPLSESGRPIELPLTKGSTLPDGSESHRLDRIIARFHADALSATTMVAFSKFVFHVSVGDKTFEDVRLEMGELEKNPAREIPLLVWRGDGQREALARVRIEVQSIYTAAFLCLQEQELFVRGTRAERVEISEALVPKACEKKPPEACKETRTLLLAEGEDTAILYSFCKRPGDVFLHEQVDWEKLARPVDDTARALEKFRFEDLSETGMREKVLQRHKMALVERLAAQLNQFPSRFGQSVVDTTSEGHEGALLFVRDEYAVTLLKAAGSVRLTEETGGGVRPLAEQMDQASEVILSLEPVICFQFPAGELLRPPWHVELEVADAKADTGTRRINIELLYRDGCTRALAAQWKDYLGQRVTLRIVFRLPEREDLVIYRDAFDVHNLGLITIFPVASEIVAATLSSSPKDIESTSVIPISWAMSVRGGRANSYAITFPFILGVNTRSAPKLAEYVALAPSVSVIAGGEQEAPSFAFGIGVNLARAFHFGYAWAPTADDGQYVLIGVSIPELLPLLSGLGASGVTAP